MAFPIPVSAGVLKFQDGVSLPVLVTSAGATVDTFAPRISNACGTGDTLTVTLSKQSGGGAADDIVAVFVDLELLPGSVTGGPVVMTAGDTLFVVLSSALADDATDLSGYVDGNFVSAAVTSAFTTLQRVQRLGKLEDVDAARDALINEQIVQVSDLMQLRLWDRIERVVGKVEFYDVSHPDWSILTVQPIVDVAVMEVRLPPFDTADIIPAAELRVEKPTLISLLSTDGTRLRFGRGEKQITYDAGFSETPPALVGAATQEVLFRLLQSAFGGSIRVGVDSRTFGETSETYESGGLLQATMEAINDHNRRVVH